MGRAPPEDTLSTTGRPRAAAALRVALSTLLAVALIVGGAAFGLWLVDVTLRAAPDPTEPAATIELALPPADVAGRDISDLPRYPGAVRTGFGTEEQGTSNVTTIEYLAAAEVDDVRAFYRRVFREAGWELIEIDANAGDWVFVVTSGRRAALVELEARGDRHTTIAIEIEFPVPGGTAPSTIEPATPPAPPPQAPPPPPPGDDDD